MSVHIDRKFLLLLSPTLQNFKEKNTDLYNFRCPYCGDSQKKKTKTRGFIYRKSNDYFYRCFNCETSTTFYKFIDFINPQLAKEYSLERYREGDTKNHNYTKPKFNFTKPKFAVAEFSIPSIKTLSDDHIARDYLNKRKIPKVFYKDLFYADNFKEFVLSVSPSCEKILPEDSRIIIPFRNEDGVLTMFQGRSLESGGIRYLTVKINANAPKIFGLDRVVKDQKIYIVEAPFDSLFLKNSIAVADSNLEYGLNVLQNVNVDKVLVPDIQPRNKHIVWNIKKWIENGYTVCLLPTTLGGKDLNEIIQTGISKHKLKEIIDEYSFSGLRASVELAKWKEID